MLLLMAVAHLKVLMIVRAAPRFVVSLLVAFSGDQDGVGAIPTFNQWLQWLLHLKRDLGHLLQFITTLPSA